MRKTPLISEIQEVLNLMLSFGFKFDHCLTYIFDREYHLVESFDIQNCVPISIQTTKDPLLFNPGLNIIAGYIKNLLAGACEQQLSVADLFPGYSSQTPVTNYFHFALDLMEGYSCLILFTSQPNEAPLFNIKETDNLICLLKIGLNSYLKSIVFERASVSAEVIKEDHQRKDFLLAFNDDMASAVTMDDMEKILKSRLTGNSLLGNIFFDFIDEPGHLSGNNISSGNSAREGVSYIVDNFDSGRADNIISYLKHLCQNGRLRFAGFPIKSSKAYGMLWVDLEKSFTLYPHHLSFYIDIAARIGYAIENIKLKASTATQLEELGRYKQILKFENTYLTDEVKNELWLEELNTYGDKMQHVNQLIRQVAFSNSTVLIQGDTGTGKELVARAIHGVSSRKSNIMVKINCAALPPGLVESELFGHEKGSFTGAFERHIGKFELAENGTLFLDEIGEMPHEVQVKVLRAIQEREIERIGGKGVIKINVRIIAATNRDLHKEVIEGRFRSDLFFRLNVFPITIPRLKDRKEDIIKLAYQFIKKFSGTAGLKTYTLSDKSIQQLLHYDWPGNVRELEHVVERSILLTRGTVIKNVGLTLVDRKFNKSGEQDQFRTLDENEREHILNALHKTNGKIYGKGGAAELLRIHFSTLNSRMKKLGIQKVVISRN